MTNDVHEVVQVVQSI